MDASATITGSVILAGSAGGRGVAWVASPGRGTSKRLPQPSAAKTRTTRDKRRSIRTDCGLRTADCGLNGELRTLQTANSEDLQSPNETSNSAYADCS